MICHVQLDAVEGRMCHLLSVIGTCNGCSVRFRGGWVRDKILGVQPSDVDVSVQGGPWCTGALFARQVCGSGLAWVMGAAPALLHVWEDCTARVLLWGRAVDVVHVRWGLTLQEDAFSRDCTVNALFFHLPTATIEDWTGTGVGDLLHRRMIRTPCCPLAVYTADPRRMLRAVRIAARLQLRLHADVEWALGTCAARAALAAVGPCAAIHDEVDAMLAGLHPHSAIAMLAHFDLLCIVVR
jgi:tRNA nucleotidyltransferase/poly(A) polymerase